MKLLSQVHLQGGKPFVYVRFGQVFFTGQQPENEQLILVDLPGLADSNFESIVQWLRQHAAPISAKTPALTKRRQIVEFSPEHWRLAQLDDVFDSEDWHAIGHGGVHTFSLETLRDFCERHHPELQARLKAIEAIPAGREKAEALKVSVDWTSRLLYVFQMVDNRLAHDCQQQLKQLDRQLWRQLRDDRQLSLSDLISELANIGTDEIRRKGLHHIADRLANDDLTDRGRRDLLRQILADKRLKSDLGWYDDKFWKKIRHVFPMPERERGITVDLTEARPITVSERWDLINARIVGPVKLDRRALAVFTQEGLQFLVAGRRHLLFRITEAGGTLEKYGCRLTVQMKSKVSLHPRLMEVERLATLAQLDPMQAVGAVADLNLPPDHLVYRTAHQARRDPAKANLLADLLIELKFSIDADVAKHLARMRATEDR